MSTPKSKIKGMRVIKQKILDELQTNNKAKLRLAYEFNTVTKTIERWINKEGNFLMLTTPTGINAIAEELEIKRSEILTKA